MVDRGHTRPSKSQLWMHGGGSSLMIGVAVGVVQTLKAGAQDLVPELVWNLSETAHK